MSTLLTIGKHVAHGLMDANKDGHIDLMDLIEVIDKVANHMGLHMTVLPAEEDKGRDDDERPDFSHTRIPLNRHRVHLNRIDMAKHAVVARELDETKEDPGEKGAK